MYSIRLQLVECKNVTFCLVQGFCLARLHPKNIYLMISAVLIWEGCSDYAGKIVSIIQGIDELVAVLLAFYEQ